VATALVAGCGGDDGETDTGPANSGAAKKPASVTVPLIVDATGPIEAFIKEVRRGWDLRIEEAQAGDELEGTKVNTDVLDSRFDAKAAANHVSKAARSDAPLALYGTSSGIAPAIAPIAQRSKLPFTAIFSGGPGVVEAGDYIFRVTAPQSSYHQLQSDYLKSQGVKRVAIIYNSDVGTVKDLAEGFYKEAAARDGYEIVESTGISATATDTASEMTGIVNSNPDAVLLLTLGQQISTGITQLRRANYDGIIATHPGVSIEGMKSLGAEADGVVWPTDFTPATETESGQKFVTAFESRYGYEPEAFAASGYDAATMVLLALERAPDFSREAVHKALQEVTEEGFESASGPLTFEERDARVQGAMVEWKDGEQTLLGVGN
jgi:branched-chain amino acid transport system substrate-binding protein